MTEKQIICTVCPSSCRLTVRELDGTITVEGNGCSRGLEHGISEYTNPMRMLTTTVTILDGTLPRLPVISTGEVSKAKLWACLEQLYSITVKAPVSCGDLIIKDICSTGIDVVASRTLELKEEE
jgi:CxxC motif-containing protein